MFLYKQRTSERKRKKTMIIISNGVVYIKQKEKKKTAFTMILVTVHFTQTT